MAKHLWTGGLLVLWLMSGGWMMAQELDTTDLKPLEPPGNQKITITGKVQTLQQAIESERGVVDWYGWYLNARAYLQHTGGLPCPMGTTITFHKSGRMEAATSDPLCAAWVSNRFFPLPKETRLDALMLPVRDGKAPPASVDEIYSRVRRQENWRH